MASISSLLFLKMPRTLVCLHEGLLRYQLLLFGHCSHMGPAVPSSLIQCNSQAFDEVKCLLDFLRYGISFQVSEPSCQQLNVQADKNVYKADFGHL